jgi:DNA helicase-2/ATP-dependent DNA helicase PcrA
MFSQSDIEEERRLAYVALTRAKKKLYLTLSARRMLFGSTMSNPTSRFLEEIPEELLEKEDKTKRLESSFTFQKPITKKGANTEKYASEITRKPNITQAEINYTIGDTVSHRAFGNGIVISMEPMSNDTLVEVAFEKVGTKKIMANFAKLQKI